MARTRIGRPKLCGWSCGRGKRVFSSPEDSSAFYLVDTGHIYSEKRRQGHEVDLSLSLKCEVQNEQAYSSSSPQDFMACKRECYIYSESSAIKQVKFVYDIRKKSRIFCGFTTLLFLCRVIYEMALLEICLSVS